MAKTVNELSKKEVSAILTKAEIDHNPKGNINEMRKLLPENWETLLEEPKIEKKVKKAEKPALVAGVDYQPDVRLGVDTINDLAQRIFECEKELGLTQPRRAT